MCAQGIDVLDKADRDHVALGVADDLELQFFPAEDRFLDEHLSNWAPLLTVEMEKFAKTDFYRGLAFLTDGFLETDFELLEDMLGIE